jgi:Flp pilus assembly protein TadG
MSSQHCASARVSPRTGTTLVETALVLMAFILFVFAIFEYGRMVMVRHLLDNAAREGARQAVVSTTLQASDIQAIVSKYLAGQEPDKTTINVYMTDPATGANLGPWQDAPFGASIAVQVEGVYHPLLPTFGLIPDGVKVRGKSVMRNEAN